ncbi:uncharacterized protein [Periplaneta americana]|uniref:uncharacterized protein isoform X2 n=1 Tax=Periplaneta americana TaxID=6978 RepID=UPI0037E91C77
MPPTGMFRLLPWLIPDSVKILSPIGIKCLKFEKRDVIIVWFRNNILIYEDVGTHELQKYSVSADNTCVEGTIVSVLQLEEVIGVYNGSGLYLLVNASDKLSQSASSSKLSRHGSITLKHHMKMHQEILALGSLSLGFVFVKKKSGKLYVDVYKVGRRMVPVEKMFSSQLPDVAYGDVSCTIKCVQCSELDSSLASALLNGAVLDNPQVIFVGLGCGQLYYLPVLLKSKTARSPEPKLLYKTTQPITGVVFIRDPASHQYAHVGVILCTGAVVYITCVNHKLCYHMMFLPGCVEDFCAVKNGIMTADGVDLWHSKFTWNKEGKAVMENRKIGMKGVCAVDQVPGSDLILAVTVHLTLYCLQLEDEHPTSRPKNFTAFPSMMSDMDAQLQHLSKLRQQIAQQEKLLEAINIGRRSQFLQNTFSLSVQVRHGIEGRYILGIVLESKDDQDFCPELWYLHISVVTDKTTIMETNKLEHRIRKGVSLRRNLTIAISQPFSQVDLFCSLITEVSEEGETNTWVTIPIARTSLDVSYFFSSVQNSVSNLSENLLKIAQSYMTEGAKRQLWEVESRPAAYKYEFRVNSKGQTADDVWAIVLRNCGLLVTDESLAGPQVSRGRELCVYIGDCPVKMSLNSDCNIMELKCDDVELLHQVKTSIAKLLEQNGSFQKPVSINKMVWEKAKMRLGPVKVRTEWPTHQRRIHEWHHPGHLLAFGQSSFTFRVHNAEGRRAAGKREFSTVKRRVERDCGTASPTLLISHLGFFEGEDVEGSG